MELYDGEIRYTDYWIENLVKEIKNLGILKETAIIITADHGEEFLDHGELGHHPKLYDEILHVPLIIYYSEVESKVIDTYVDLLDLGPTIIDLFGFKNPKFFLGKSLIKEIKEKPIISEVSNPHGILAVNKKFKKVSCRKGGWKVILSENESKVELYNLKEDPEEKNNLAREKRKKLEELFKKIVVHEKKSISMQLTKIRGRV